jgi:hypothetical protein
MTELSLATWVLMVAAFGMTAVASVGIYQSLFVMPEYFAAPPGSLRRYQGDRSWRFWLPLHAVTAPALVFAVITTWSAGRHGLVLAAALCYTASWVATAIWFIPGVIEFNKVDTGRPYTDEEAAELAAKGRRWLRRSTVRLVLMLAAAVMLTLALGV